jgi:hypothetical protein
MSSFVKTFLDGMFSNIKGLRGIGRGNLTHDGPSSRRDVDAGADRAGGRRRSSMQISTSSDFLEEYVFVILKNLIVRAPVSSTGQPPGFRVLLGEGERALRQGLEIGENVSAPLRVRFAGEAHPRSGDKSRPHYALR